MTAALYSSCVFVALLSVLSVTGAVKDCPPWSTWDNSTPQCVCSDSMEYAITCDQKKQRSFLQLTYCACHNTTITGTVVAECPYVFPDHLIVDGYIPLPNKSSELNHFICGNLNRTTGTPLCGRCTSGTGPSIYSFGSQCVSCSAVNIVYYLLLQYLPTTILFVAITVFRINITSAPMAHYVLYCDLLVLLCKSHAGLANFHHITYYKSFYIFSTLSGIWTLDFFFFVSPPLCVAEHMEEIYVPFLDTVATLYPFILLLLTYIGIELHAHDFRPVVQFWRPIQRTYVRFRRTWDPNASVIQAFATLFFLSYAKLIVLMYEALFISVVTNEKGEVVSRVPYIDPTVSIFSHKHWYLISLSCIILVFIILPPLLVLTVFPTHLFRKISRCLKPRWVVSMQTFVDTFHGCYKDGTNWNPRLQSSIWIHPGNSDDPSSSRYHYKSTRNWKPIFNTHNIHHNIHCSQCCVCTAQTIQTQNCQHFWSDSTCNLLFSMCSFYSIQNQCSQRDHGCQHIIYFPIVCPPLCAVWLHCVQVGETAQTVLL